MNDSLLIVGGTGFIGRNLVLSALELGYNIVVLSLNEPSDNKKIEGVEYLQMDITDPIQSRKKLMETSFDYVVNLSGYIDHCVFLEGGHEIIKAHFEGVQNLLQLLNWSKLKRFVQIGSSDEYGNHQAPQHEGVRELPISPYSLGKVASSQFLQMLYRTQGFPAVIIRLFLTYGPGQNTSRFLPQIIQRCLSNECFPATEGKQLRDFCYVKDVTRAILMSLENDNILGEIINIASGEPISIRETVNLIQKKIGKGDPVFGEIPYRTKENMELYADISKAEELLGWRPEISFDEGIERTIQYFLAENESREASSAYAIRTGASQEQTLDNVKPRKTIQLSKS